MTPKSHPILFSAPMVRAILENRKRMTRRIILPRDILSNDPLTIRPSLLWKKGDMLWVKETYFLHPIGFLYKANYTEGGFRGYVEEPPAVNWRSGRFMPRLASRLLLELTADVRAEYLQDITEADAIAEGITGPFDVGFMGFRVPGDTKPRYSTAESAFEALWDSIHENDGHGWDANDFVRVIEFRRLKP